MTEEESNTTTKVNEAEKLHRKNPHDLIAFHQVLLSLCLFISRSYRYWYSGRASYQNMANTQTQKGYYITQLQGNTQLHV